MKLKVNFRSIALVLLTIAGFAGCKKADNYYEKLRLEPELYNKRAYDEVYGIGDTLTMYGRFVSNDVTIHIGDAEATIIEKKNAALLSNISKDSMQVMKVRITREMGIGQNRSISIIASGITIKAPSIEIVSDRNASILSREITVQRIAAYPTGFQNVYCRSGNGNMYFINTSSIALIKIDATGVRSQLAFDASKLKDNDGTAFTITRFNGFGIDPDETYLYLSLYQQAPSGTQLNYYRLCRYDLKSGSFTVLNKTAYGVTPNMNTEATAKPFEGSIQSVKMFTATGIYPGKNNIVYFNMDNQFITRLDASGNYTYQFKNTDEFAKLVDVAPQVYDPATGSYKNRNYLRQLMPGKEIGFRSLITIDPSNALLYVDNSNLIDLQLLDIRQYDLLKLEAGNSLSRLLVNNGIAKPYSVGSFATLNYSSGSNGIFGLLPLSDGRVVMLKYQDLANNNTYKLYKVPHWAIIDFNAQQGQLYAPGMFDRKGYTLSSNNDFLLNYDDQGMLYMTANNKSSILKTVYK